MVEERRIYRPLGRMLKEAGLVTEKQLEQALEEQRTSGKFLGRVLIELGFVSEEDVLQALGFQAGIETVDLDNLEIQRNVIDKISASVAKIYNIIPVRFENNTLAIAIADPLNINIMDDLQFMLDCKVKSVVAKEDSIIRALQKYYGTEVESMSDLIATMEQEIPEVTAAAEEELDIASLREMAAQAPVVKLVALILSQSVKDHASDIHFEPFEDEFRIRYRIDGVLYDMVPPPKRLAIPVTCRIKVMADMDIAERRLPQDGHMPLRIGQKNIDFRVSTLPTVFGESVVLRVLDKTVVSLDLNQIGFPADVLLKLRQIIAKPNGIVIATGPTGCGKTTTLYSCLREVNSVEVKILTTEDPVEYDMPGIIQVQIKPKIKLTFASCLRSFLRQDPDIIMVGEIRDTETAQIAIQASLTGHLVFSTLHTNDAPGTITRLMDMEVEPFLITSSIEAIFAQRLVRKICQHCRTEYTADDYVLKELGLTRKNIEGKKLYYGTGCERCNNTGYLGRTAICELFIVNDTIRELILQRVSTSELRKAAQAFGMRTLREDGLMKIFDGTTTVEEIIRETQLAG
ncbi:type II secretion system protein GspE [bacterium Unc6]|nr:type II secretion system protein GspE [bacterium Unc6]